MKFKLVPSFAEQGEGKPRLFVGRVLAWQDETLLKEGEWYFLLCPLKDKMCGTWCAQYQPQGLYIDERTERQVCDVELTCSRRFIRAVEIPPTEEQKTDG